MDENEKKNPVLPPDPKPEPTINPIPHNLLQTESRKEGEKIILTEEKEEKKKK